MESKKNNEEDIAPERLSFGAASQLHDKQLCIEKDHQRRVEEVRRSKSQRKKRKQPENVSPSNAQKKVRLIKWLESEDIFHFKGASSHELGQRAKRSTKPKNESKRGFEEERAFESIPSNVLAAFEQALGTSVSAKEVKDAWTQIVLAEQSKQKSSIKMVNDCDTVIVDGFELQLDEVFRKKEHYRATMKRALSLSRFIGQGHRRESINRQASMGKRGPALEFAQPKLRSSNMSFWGHQIKKIRKNKPKESEIDHWLQERDW